MASFTKLLSGIIKQGEKWVGNEPEYKISNSDGNCMLCYSFFGLTSRKFLCYICSCNVCDKCSSNNFESNSKSIHRVCDDCLDVCNCTFLESPLSSIRFHKLLWKSKDPLLLSSFTVELCFTISCIRGLPVLVTKKCPIHVDSSTLTKFNPREASTEQCTCYFHPINNSSNGNLLPSDMKHLYAIFYNGHKEIYRTKSIPINSSSIEWKNELFSAVFDIRNPWSSYVTIEIYTSYSPSISFSSSPSGGINQSIPKEPRDMLGKCRIHLHQFMSSKLTRVNDNDINHPPPNTPLLKPILFTTAIVGKRFPYYVSESQYACEIDIVVAQLNKGKEVEGHVPYYRDISIPGAVPWDQINQSTSSSHQSHTTPPIQLSSLFQSNGLRESLYFNGKSSSMSNNAATDIPLHDELNMLPSTEILLHVIDNIHFSIAHTATDISPLVFNPPLPTSANQRCPSPSITENATMEPSTNNDKSPRNQSQGTLNASIDDSSTKAGALRASEQQLVASASQSLANQPGILLLTSHRLIYISSSSSLPLFISHCEIDTIVYKSKWRDRYALLEMMTMMDGITYRFVVDSISGGHPSSMNAINWSIHINRLLRFTRDEVQWRKDENAFTRRESSPNSSSHNYDASITNALMDDYTR